MPLSTRIRRDFVEEFGDAYQHFGLPRLMGHIVGLLLYESGPLSLDDITSTLHVSKGPVSQITRRLSESGLIRKVWVPGSRRVHYQAEDEIFGRAFARHAGLLAQNRVLAGRFCQRLDQGEDDVPEHFRRRVQEMHSFYGLMEGHLQGFLEAWRQRRRELVRSWSEDEQNAG